MEKFVRTKLDYNGMSYQDRIQKNIDLAKQLNTKLTWEQAKQMQRESDKQEIWVNDIYQVNILRGKNCDQYVLAKPFKGLIDYLTIKRHDKKAIHDWRHFQIIKNELCGEDREAVEIYPAENRLVDTANQFHLWVIPNGDSMPFGFTERLVNYTESKGGYGQPGQRGKEI